MKCWQRVDKFRTLKQTLLNRDRSEQDSYICEHCKLPSPQLVLAQAHLEALMTANDALLIANEALIQNLKDSNQLLDAFVKLANEFP